MKDIQSTKRWKFPPPHQHRKNVTSYTSLESCYPESPKRITGPNFATSTARESAKKKKMSIWDMLEYEEYMYGKKRVGSVEVYKKKPGFGMEDIEKFPKNFMELGNAQINTVASKRRSLQAQSHKIMNMMFG